MLPLWLYGSPPCGVEPQVKVSQLGPSGSDTSPVSRHMQQFPLHVAGSPLPDEQIVAEIGTFLMGGLETTAHSLSFTLYCIATNPGVQEAIMRELIQNNLIPTAGSCFPLLQYDHLIQLRYLDAVLKESMRMYPAVTGFPR